MPERIRSHFDLTIILILIHPRQLKALFRQRVSSCPSYPISSPTRHPGAVLEQGHDCWRVFGRWMLAGDAPVGKEQPLTNGLRVRFPANSSPRLDVFAAVRLLVRP